VLGFMFGVRVKAEVWASTTFLSTYHLV